MTEIRALTEADRAQVANALRVSLNIPRSLSEARAPLLPLEQFRCVVDGGRIITTAAARDYTQWFGGRELAMSGVWGVTTMPEHRGEGLASAAVLDLMRDARDRGMPLTALYPATPHPYRRLGYELAGTFTEHTVPLEDLPTGGGPLTVEEYRPEDLPAVRACYRTVAARHDGPIDADEEEWWGRRLMNPRDADAVSRAVVVRGPGDDVEAYTMFTQQKAEGSLDVAFKLACNHLMASTPDALRTLLGYLNGFRGLGQTIEFTGPPAEPLAMLVKEQRVVPTWTYRWMLRLLDVPAALEGRGYAPVSGTVTLDVRDERFPDNAGPWRIEADAGTVRVTRSDGPAPLVTIGTLSSMYSGFLGARDALRLGLLSADEATVTFLEHLLRGPAPFMYDFF